MCRPPQPDSSLLHSMLSSGAAVHPWFVSELSVDVSPGLLTARSLADGSADVAGLVDEFQEACGFGDRRVAGMLLVARFGWFTAGAVTTLVSADRLPSLGIDDVDFRLDLPNKRSRCLLRRHDLYALPGDHIAIRRGACVRPTVGHLHDDLAAAFVAHTGPLVEAVATTSRAGRRGLWAMATASLGNSFLTAGRHLDKLPQALDHMRSVVARDPRLRRSAPTPFAVDAAADGVHLCRAACCLVFLEPGHDKCPTSCPLIPEDERRRAVRASLAR
jgi:hypothetical protein